MIDSHLTVAEAERAAEELRRIGFDATAAEIAARTVREIADALAGHNARRRKAVFDAIERTSDDPLGAWSFHGKRLQHT